MSIYSKIKIIFMIASMFATAFFVAFFYIEKLDDIKVKEQRYIQMVYLVQSIYNQALQLNIDKNLKKLFQENEFLIVDFKKNKDKIINRSTLVLQKNISNTKLKMYRKYGDFYLLIEDPKYTLLLQDTAQRDFLRYTVVLYIMTIILLILLYVWITHSIKPLKELQTKIQQISAGDLNVSLKSPGHDEIAQVANAFDDALIKLKSLINSRQFFLRSVMHELKTPISKGILLNEFLEDKQQKKSYKAIFERLHLLLEEFSKIEKMLSMAYRLKITTCNSIDAVEHALELLMLDADEIAQKITIEQEGHFFVKVDFELFVLALKNLIDNALKYASDGKVLIKISKEHLVISNYGKELEKPLKAYLHPFSESKNGLGLGLYIVLNIMHLLHLKLRYTYKESQNIFTISSFVKVG